MPPRSSTASEGKDLPVIVVGAGPVGLTTALGLSHYGIPCVVLEDDARLSVDTKAGTLLTRALEVFRRYGAADEVMSRALRLDEIGDIERATNRSQRAVHTEVLRDDTRYPFVINLPQQDLEPALAEVLARSTNATLLMRHKLVSFEDKGDHVVVDVETPEGKKQIKGRYLLACDGGRSTVRHQLGVKIAGESLEIRYMLIDLKIDLDVRNPRDYPYLAYFSDPQEWMILVRHPHCWRFLFPLAADAIEPSAEELRDKVLRFIGEVEGVEIVGKVVYAVHLRVAEKWRVGNAFLMGDAAHLITPMWGLGVVTGALDASNLPWRLAWVLRGWAEPGLLDGYEVEQLPVASQGSLQMAEGARAYMQRSEGDGSEERIRAMSGADWGLAYTRSLLGVRLDVDGSGDWSMVKTEASPPPLRAGDRLPDFPLHGPDGRPLRAHDLTADSFVALWFTDSRRRPPLPADDVPGLRHFVVSRWDAPHDSGLRPRSLLDVGELFRKRVGCPADTVVLVRPDDHVAAVLPMNGGLSAVRAYLGIIGRG